jgi:hypothetical protein
MINVGIKKFKEQSFRCISGGLILENPEFLDFNG